MATFLVRNPSGSSPVSVSDLGGQVWLASETLDLLLLYKSYTILTSSDLKTALDAGTLIRVAGGSDVAAGVAYDDLGTALVNHVNPSWARSIGIRAESLARIKDSYATSYGDITYNIASEGSSIALMADHHASEARSYAKSIAGMNSLSLAVSLATVADSMADRAELKASEANSVANVAVSLAKVAVETSNISEASSIGSRGLSIARLTESQGTLDNSLADLGISYAKRAESQGTLDNSLADLGISYAKRAESQGTLDNSLADLGSSIARRSESLAQRAESQGTLDNSLADLGISYAKRAESQGILDNSLADLGTSIAIRGESLAKRAESQGTLDNSLADLGISYAKRAESQGTLDNSLADLGSSIARRGESLSKRAESQGTLDNSLADRASSMGTLGASIGRRAESQGTLDNSIADKAESLARVANNKLPRNFIQNSTPAGTLAEGDCWYHTDDNLWYSYDGSEWISDEKETFAFGKKGSVDGAYLGIATVDGSSGALIERNAKIMSVTAVASGGEASKALELRKDGAAASIFSFALSSSKYINTAVATNISANSFLQCFVSSTLGPVADPVVIVKVAWRRSAT